jgi:hypothetical protein
MRRNDNSPSHRLYDVVVSYGLFDERSVKWLEGEVDNSQRLFGIENLT